MQHKISLMTICKTIKQFTFQFYAPAVLTVLSLLFLGASSILDCEQSLFSQSSLSSAGLERANWPRGKLERGGKKRDCI